VQKNNPDVPKPSPARLRCAIYTRKSTEEGLEQEFNSLDAQREAAEAFIQSQRREGWIALPESYDDGGFTGANMDRPALTRLLHAVEAGQLDCVVVYKVDRLSRSLLDFTRMLSVFEKHNVSFVAVTQQFNTSTSLGRLTLNILLSFAQFERELIGERTRDKMAAARRKGKWVGGCPVLGYDVDPGGGRLVVNEEEAVRVRTIFELFEEHGSARLTLAEIERRDWRLKSWTRQTGQFRAGGPFALDSLRRLNETKEVSAAEQVKVLTGNAGALTISLNGKTLDSLGSRGQMREVMLTAEGSRLLSKDPPPAAPDPL
jgi:site-specific DNA recombinase